MTWNISDPIVLIIRPLEQLRKLASHAGVPCTNVQTLQKGLFLIIATRDYENALTLWDIKSMDEKFGIILRHTSKKHNYS